MSTFSCAVKNQNPANSNETTILTYNIHHANPPSKPEFIDIDAICRVITESGADIVALQEVDRQTKRSGNIDQAQVIAKKLGFNYHFFKAIDHDGGDYGLAILSKLPIKDPQTHRLPQVEKAEERILAMLQVKVGKEWIYFANTHLDASKSQDNRITQMKHINEVVSKAELPVIICGDFNSRPDSEVIRIMDTQFKRTCVDDCLPTIPQINPRNTIDYIATRNLSWKQQHIEVIQETYASDHLPVKVVFQR
jgi:endonuclease/exonuclease/phosphatase family metal-dependent hydrolase